jgi:dipeptidyl aminopeptidase/acylaminoacyl peptidase
MRTLLALLLQATQTTAPSPPATVPQAAAAPRPAPTIDQLVELKRVTSVALNPDGNLVAYVLREANWDENAYELYQGLVDQGVEAKLVVFKGFGHGLNKPKAVRAALEQNLSWFSERVLDAK